MCCYTKPSCSERARCPRPIQYRSTFDDFTNVDVPPFSLLIIIQICIAKGDIVLRVEFSNQPVEVGRFQSVAEVYDFLVERSLLGFVEIWNSKFHTITLEIGI